MSVEMVDDPDEAILDFEIAHFSPKQLEAAWRSLCAQCLISAAVVARSDSNCASAYQDRMIIRRWFSGGGIISFSDACEATDFQPERIVEVVNARRRKFAPINKWRTSDADACRKTENAGGLVAARFAVTASGDGGSGKITSRRRSPGTPVPSWQDRDGNRRQAGRPYPAGDCNAGRRGAC